jgi:hypothetical protein
MNNLLGVPSMKKKQKSIERLQKALSIIPDLKNRQSGSQKFKKWKRDTEIAIEYIFDKGPRHIKDFNKISYSLPFCSASTPDSAFHQAYLRGLDSAEAILTSMIDEIKEYWPDNTEPPPKCLKKPFQKTAKKYLLFMGMIMR